MYVYHYCGRRHLEDNHSEGMVCWFYSKVNVELLNTASSHREARVGIFHTHQFLIHLLPASFLNLPKQLPMQVKHIQVFLDSLFADT